MPSQGDNGMKGKGIQLFSHDDVYIYFLNPEDEGHTKRDTVTVRLVMISQEEQDAISDYKIPPAFLEAGGWFYPLIHAKTPVYRTDENYHVFPDLLSSPGSSVGIVFPANMSDNMRNLFEHLLLDFAGLVGFPTLSAGKFGYAGGSIEICDDENDDGHSIRSVAKDCGNGIMNMADKAGKGMTAGFELMSKGTGMAKCGVKSGCSSVKEYTGNAVEFGGDTISRLADATTKVAVFSGHYAQKQGKRGAGAVCDGVNYVKDGAMDTMGYVYEHLHDAGKTLASAIVNNHVLDHRFGAGKPQIMEVGTKAIVSCHHNDTGPAHMVVAN